MKRRSKLQKRETIRIVARAEKEANDRVMRLLVAAFASQERGRTVYLSIRWEWRLRPCLEAWTLRRIYPIKPIPDGWDESIPDEWDDDDDDDLLEGV
jgi:hypothetical protein